MGERHLAEPLDLLLGRDVGPVDTVLLVQLLDPRVRREHAVDEARGVPEQILYRDVAVRRDHAVDDLAGDRVEL
jgi:hypothetical protein